MNDLSTAADATQLAADLDEIQVSLVDASVAPPDVRRASEQLFRLQQVRTVANSDAQQFRVACDNLINRLFDDRSDLGAAFLREALQQGMPMALLLQAFSNRNLDDEIRRVLHRLYPHEAPATSLRIVTWEALQNLITQQNQTLSQRVAAVGARVNTAEILVGTASRLHNWHRRRFLENGQRMLSGLPDWLRSWNGVVGNLEGYAQREMGAATDFAAQRRYPPPSQPNTPARENELHQLQVFQDRLTETDQWLSEQPHMQPFLLNQQTLVAPTEAVIRQAELRVEQIGRLPNLAGSARGGIHGAHLEFLRQVFGEQQTEREIGEWLVGEVQTMRERVALVRQLQVSEIAINDLIANQAHDQINQWQETERAPIVLAARQRASEYLHEQIRQQVRTETERRLRDDVELAIREEACRHIEGMSPAEIDQHIETSVADHLPDINQRVSERLANAQSTIDTEVARRASLLFAGNVPQRPIETTQFLRRQLNEIDSRVQGLESLESYGFAFPRQLEAWWEYRESVEVELNRTEEQIGDDADRDLDDALTSARGFADQLQQLSGLRDARNQRLAMLSTELGELIRRADDVQDQFVNEALSGERLEEAASVVEHLVDRIGRAGRLTEAFVVEEQDLIRTRLNDLLRDITGHLDDLRRLSGLQNDRDWINLRTDLQREESTVRTWLSAVAGNQVGMAQWQQVRDLANGDIVNNLRNYRRRLNFLVVQERHLVAGAVQNVMRTIQGQVDDLANRQTLHGVTDLVELRAELTRWQTTFQSHLDLPNTQSHADRLDRTRTDIADYHHAEPSHRQQMQALADRHGIVDHVLTAEREIGRLRTRLNGLNGQMQFAEGITALDNLLTHQQITIANLRRRAVDQNPPLSLEGARQETRQLAEARQQRHVELRLTEFELEQELHQIRGQMRQLRELPIGSTGDNALMPRQLNRELEQRQDEMETMIRRSDNDSLPAMQQYVNEQQNRQRNNYSPHIQQLQAASRRVWPTLPAPRPRPIVWAPTPQDDPDQNLDLAEWIKKNVPGYGGPRLLKVKEATTEKAQPAPPEATEPQDPAKDEVPPSDPSPPPKSPPKQPPVDSSVAGPSTEPRKKWRGRMVSKLRHNTDKMGEGLSNFIANSPFIKGKGAVRQSGGVVSRVSAPGNAPLTGSVFATHAAQPMRTPGAAISAGAEISTIDPGVLDGASFQALLNRHGDLFGHVTVNETQRTVRVQLTDPTGQPLDQDRQPANVPGRRPAIYALTLEEAPAMMHQTLHNLRQAHLRPPHQPFRINARRAPAAAEASSTGNEAPDQNDSKKFWKKWGRK